MTNQEARNQLCKMLGEIASTMGIDAPCVCGEGADPGGGVPDNVISVMWTAICDLRDKTEVEVFDG
jgi:hypothetical protein